MTSVPALTTGARINLRSLCMDAPLGANLNKCLRKGGFNNKPLSKAKTLIPLDLHNTTQISGLCAAFNGFPVTRGTRYIYRIYMCMAIHCKELDSAHRLDSVCEGCFKFDIAIMQRFRLVVLDIQHRVDDV